jgi:hypothetical protein
MRDLPPRHLPRQERIAVERSSSFPKLYLDPSLQLLTKYPLPPASSDVNMAL